MIQTRNMLCLVYTQLKLVYINIAAKSYKYVLLFKRFANAFHSRLVAFIYRIRLNYHALLQ